jgi:chemotaxis protein MotA
MYIFIGIAMVIGGVLGGFVMHGGPLAVLLQWNEFLIIGGSALGSLLIGTPPAVLKQLGGNAVKILRGDPYTEKEFLKLLKTLFEVCHVAQREGLMNLESHVTAPAKSAIFTKNPFLLKNHHALTYLCDTMKLMLGGGIPPYDVEALMDADNESRNQEGAAPPSLIQKLADSLPGLGIVAAVLGIVTTMQAINGPPEEIGMKVAAALVGTFLGVLLSYGFFQPVATHMELLHQSEARYFECIKAGLVAYAKGSPAIIAVEFARRVIYGDVRPSFEEVEEAVREIRVGKG